MVRATGDARNGAVAEFNEIMKEKELQTAQST